MAVNRKFWLNLKSGLGVLPAGSDSPALNLTGLIAVG